jgi:AcrR family transcriptional regulator
MSNSVSLGNMEESGALQRAERRDAAANRVLVLEAAARLIAERGVATVSMADIATAAGVGKGTLYRRFANKAELCLALMDSQMQEFQDAMLARMRQMTVEGVPKMAQLDQFLDSLVYFTEAHVPLLCEVQRQGLLDTVDDQRQSPHFWQHMTLSGLLHGAMADGDLPEGLDIQYLADAILATLHADIFQFQRQGREFSPERISAGLRKLVSCLAD